MCDLCGTEKIACRQLSCALRRDLPYLSSNSDDDDNDDDDEVVEEEEEEDENNYTEDVKTTI